MFRRTCTLFSLLSALGASWLLAGSAHAQTVINFDDVAELIGTHYLDQGVMFYKGNDVQGNSTGIEMSGGQPVTAFSGEFGTAISGTRTLLPAPGSNNDVITEFFSSPNQRTFADFIGITNDTEGQPPVILEAFDINDQLIGSTAPLSASESGTVSVADIYSAKIIGQPGAPGNLGVDDFRFTLQPTSAVPEPGSIALLMGAATTFGTLLLRRRR